MWNPTETTTTTHFRRGWKLEMLLKRKYVSNHGNMRFSSSLHKHYSKCTRYVHWIFPFVATNSLLHLPVPVVQRILFGRALACETWNGFPDSAIISNPNPDYYSSIRGRRCKVLLSLCTPPIWYCRTRVAGAWIFRPTSLFYQRTPPPFTVWMSHPFIGELSYVATNGRAGRALLPPCNQPPHPGWQSMSNNLLGCHQIKFMSNWILFCVSHQASPLPTYSCLTRYLWAYSICSTFLFKLNRHTPPDLRTRNLSLNRE